MRAHTPSPFPHMPDESSPPASHGFFPTTPLVPIGIGNRAFKTRKTTRKTTRQRQADGVQSSTTHRLQLGMWCSENRVSPRNKWSNAEHGVISPTGPILEDELEILGPISVDLAPTLEDAEPC